MKIIGVGCGPGMLTEQAIREISRATIIFGSDRAIELAKSHIPFDCTVKTIDDFKNLDKLAKDAIILSTGDPMLAGLGYLRGEVIPGISLLMPGQAAAQQPAETSIPDKAWLFIPFKDYSQEDNARILAEYKHLRVADVSDGMDVVGLQDVGLVDPEIHALWKDTYTSRIASSASRSPRATCPRTGASPGWTRRPSTAGTAPSPPRRSCRCSRLAPSS